MTHTESKKGKTMMNPDERVPRTAVGKPEPAEAALEELGEFIGGPTRRQKEIIASLSRLQHSLRGPEDLLDKRSYSRPLPPAPSHQGKEKGMVLASGTAD